MLGGRVPCQSHRRTVPNEPSPKVLIGVNERLELEFASPTTSFPFCMDTAGMPVTCIVSFVCEEVFEQGGWLFGRELLFESALLWAA